MNSSSRSDSGTISTKCVISEACIGCSSVPLLDGGPVHSVDQPYDNDFPRGSIVDVMGYIVQKRIRTEFNRFEAKFFDYESYFNSSSVRLVPVARVQSVSEPHGSAWERATTNQTMVWIHPSWNFLYFSSSQNHLLWDELFGQQREKCQTKNPGGSTHELPCPDISTLCQRSNTPTTDSNHQRRRRCRRRPT